jgi:hypothetical protein
MKKLTTMAIAALLMLNIVPAFAQETPQDKYICQLQAGTCLKEADVVQRKMKKVEGEIKKGKKTYSAEDLKQIEQKLKEVEQMLDNLKAK